jgi:anti-sigma regulatory factor (Ser/Thr protein kinase)
MPGRARIVRTMRQTAMKWLREQHTTLDEAAINDVGTAMGEALSNVARHALSASWVIVNVSFGVGWCAFRVECDGGDRFRPRAALLRGRERMVSLETSGRGLAIMDGLLDELRVTNRASGTVVEGRRSCGCGGQI